MHANPEQEKQELRAKMRAARLAHPAANPDSFKALAKHLQALIPHEGGKIISAYRPFRGEMDPGIAVTILRNLGHQIALPLVTKKGQPLIFRLYKEGDVLAANGMAIMEPLSDAPIVEPDILLVPLLAFDRNYNRLGYGAGYYDRTLTGLRGQKPILAIGVGFASQEVALVPHGPHDAKLDRVATELNVF